MEKSNLREQTEENKDLSAEEKRKLRQLKKLEKKMAAKKKKEKQAQPTEAPASKEDQKFIKNVKKQRKNSDIPEP
jgi:hypothetical protein